MKAESSGRNLSYGRALFSSGLSGLRTGRNSQPDRQRLSTVLAGSTLASLSLAAIGACAGLLQFQRNGRRSLSRTIAYGVAGGAIGFAAGLAWKTRDLTARMGRSALKEMGTVRDQHWIEKHPVNYG